MRGDSITGPGINDGDIETKMNGLKDIENGKKVIVLTIKV